MPFYLSKSLRAGPFRLNLSSRGVGVSAGVPGFRVGTGPRGNYVRLAGGLVFYGASRAARSRRAPAPQPQAIPYQPPVPSPADVLLQNVTGATIMELAASSSSDLLDQIRKAAARRWLWPWLAAAVLLLALLLPPIPAVILIVLAIPGIIWVYLFLPDQILVREGRSYAEIPYPACSVTVQPTNFIESGRVPQDSQFVAWTWKYVNVRGGPDRRYKDNRQLPVVRYAELTLSATSGFHSIWQISRAELADRFARPLWEMAEFRRRSM